VGEDRQADRAMTKTKILQAPVSSPE